MKRKLRASYTVEAAIVMAIVLWSLLVSMQAAYKLHDRVVGAMAVSEASQRLRHIEKEKDEAQSWAVRRAGKPFSWGGYQFSVKLSGNPITGRRVKSSGKAGDWELELEMGVFNPEDFLRRLSLIDREE